MSICFNCLLMRFSTDRPHFPAPHCVTRQSTLLCYYLRATSSENGATLSRGVKQFSSSTRSISYLIHQHHRDVCLSHDRSIALSQQLLHQVRSSSSSFNFQYHIVSSRSSTSCLRLLPRISSLLCFLQLRVSEGSSYATRSSTSCSLLLPRISTLLCFLQ
jgi:hypothetical protein